MKYKLTTRSFIEVEGMVFNSLYPIQDLDKNQERKFKWYIDNGILVKVDEPTVYKQPQIEIPKVVIKEEIKETKVIEKVVEVKDEIIVPEKEVIIPKVSKPEVKAKSNVVLRSKK